MQKKLLYPSIFLLILIPAIAIGLSPRQDVSPITGTPQADSYRESALAALPGNAPSQSALPAAILAPPKVDAKSVIIIDMARGDILYEQNPDEVISPASLTKIMTMSLALEAVKSGKIGLLEHFDITKEDVTLPYRSALMYLKEGMSVPFEDLLKGMAVISGNDGANSVARILAGNNDDFAALMNREARRLGLSATSFVEPSGLSEHNLTSARDMASLARSYLQRFPDALHNYHSLTYFNFPRADVMPGWMEKPAGKILLKATNGLLFSYDGCDGLKTGYIDEAGYNLIATAERDGTRIISVSMGGTEGPAARDRTGRTLLDWAFENWKTVKLPLPELDNARVWGGSYKYARLNYGEPGMLTVPKKLSGSIKLRIDMDSDIKAPLEAGAILGKAVVLSGETVLRRIDILNDSDIPKGNLFVRMRDGLERLFRKG
ncbi:D-alanyl-D-alanine carboxypeptidase family protein [Spirochaetota bacterium]